LANQASKYNALARASYADFTTQGIKATPEVMASPQLQAMAQEIRSSSPGISNADLDRRLGEYLSSSATIPTQTVAASGGVLVKVVPKGEGVSAYTPFWMSPEQARAIAVMTPEQVARALGLPASQAARILQNGMDFYAITPKPGLTPTVFVSDIAPTLQGKVATRPSAQQVIVPNRNLWTDPKLINPFTLR
jgi:filamentous hemagglutinin